MIMAGSVEAWHDIAERYPPPDAEWAVECYAHPTDPPAPFRAVPTFARLIADGLLRMEEWREAIADVPSRDTRTRLAHALADAVAAIERERARARAAVERCEWRIRYAVRPLIEARAPKHEVEEAAGRAAQGEIGWDRIFAILREEVARARHLSRRRAR
jgi:hypothetical protein